MKRLPLFNCVQWLVLLTFLLIQIGGFQFTMSKVYPSYVHWRLVHMSYGMMAPWQTYTTINTELVAEGLTAESEWEHINLRQYFPYLVGERGVRETLRTFRGGRREQFRRLATRIKHLEEQNGRHYSSVQLFWERWPKSALGYEAQRTEELTTRSTIILE